MRYKKPKKTTNSSFLQFCLRNDITVDLTTHDMTHLNHRSGFSSIAKYAKTQPDVDDLALKIAESWLEREFGPHMRGSAVQTYEAVTPQIDKTTSAGYPFNLEYINKKDLLNKRSTFRDETELLFDKLATDEPIHSFWTCAQKHEMRSVKKLSEDPPKHRTFTASSADLTINANRLFLDMNNKFYRSHGKTSSFVGGSKFKKGFDLVYRRLARHKFGFALDESDFDASVFQKAMWIVARFRYKMLRPEDRTIENWKRIQNVYYQIINSMIVLEDGTVVMKDTGNPSGSVNTVVDNTLVLHIISTYAWVRLYAKHMNLDRVWLLEGKDYLTQSEWDELQASIKTVLSFNHFKDNVELVLYGDDNTFTVSPECISWFNAVNIIEVWKSLGITTKTDDTEPRNYYDLDFLSQRVLKYKGCWLPYPDPSTIVNSLYHKTTIDDPRWHLLRAYALRNESWAHEPTRLLLQGYIDYLIQDYSNSLHGDVKVPGTEVFLPMKDIYSVYLTDDELERLYLGLEVAGSNFDSRPQNLSLSVDRSSECHITHVSYCHHTICIVCDSLCA